MRWLMRAIGRVLGITQAVGHVPQTQDSPTGGNNNTAVSKPQRVKRESKAKLSAAQQDIQDQSSKTETLSVRTRTKKSSTAGTQSATPALKPVSQKLKRKLKAVHKITADKLSKQIQKHAQQEHGQGGSQVATPVLPILLHAKPQVRAKQARVLRTTQALSQVLEQVPALTLTEAQSGGHGKRKATASQSSQRKPKPLAVQSTTADKSRNKEQSPLESQERGQQSVIRASKTLQPAQQAKTKKQKVVVSTTVAKKGTLGKTRAQTRTVRLSKAHGS